MTARSVLSELWHAVGAPPDLLADVRLTGCDPVLPSSFKVGLAAQTAIAASALAAADLWRIRSGARQTVGIDMRHAAAEFRSERYLRLDGKAASDPWDKIPGIYRCGDGSWVRLHTNFPHHRDSVLRLLDCAHEREAVGRALAGWNAVAFEEKAAEAGMVVAALRSFEEWDAHPQGKAVAGLPLVAIERIGEAEAAASAARRAPAFGRARSRSHPRHRRTCVRAHLGGSWGRRASRDRAPSSRHRSFGHRYGPRQTFDEPRSARRGGEGQAGAATLRRRCLRPGLSPRRARLPRLCTTSRGGDASGIVYVSLCAYGQAGPWSDRRGSTRSCKPPAASTTRKRGRQAPRCQSRFPPKCSITRPDTSWPSAP